MSMFGKVKVWRAARKAAGRDRENRAIWAGLTSQSAEVDRDEALRQAKQRQIADEQERRTITGMGT